MGIDQAGKTGHSTEINDIRSSRRTVVDGRESIICDRDCYVAPKLIADAVEQRAALNRYNVDRVRSRLRLRIERARRRRGALAEGKLGEDNNEKCEAWHELSSQF